MAGFKLQIKCDNAAFADAGRAHEVNRILREAAFAVLQGSTEGTLRDYNGNRVGEWKFTR